MPTTERRADRGRQRGMRINAEVGRAIRLARRSRGISQRLVAGLVGISQATMSRIEAGRGRTDLVHLAMIGDVLGLELVVNLFPGGSPVRDAGHVRLMNRLRRRLPDDFVLRTEVPMPMAGDRRAMDAMTSAPRLSVGFELESRLTDAQALVRRVILKQRDAGIESMIIVFPDTTANRAAVAAAAATLRPSFPLDSRAVLAALREHRVPTGNGILFV